MLTLILAYGGNIEGKSLLSIVSSQYLASVEINKIQGQVSPNFWGGLRCLSPFH